MTRPQPKYRLFVAVALVVGLGVSASAQARARSSEATELTLSVRDRIARLGVGLRRLVGDLDSTADRLRGWLAELPRLTVVPVDAPPSSPYGYRRDPLRKRRQFHGGLDFAADHGDPVLSAGAGRVVEARWRRGYGRIVVVDHGFGVETRYAHLRRIEVRRGDVVEPGQPVGIVGSSGRSTGPHLHFEVRRHGRPVDPREAMQIPTRHEWALAHSLRSTLQL